MYNYIKNLKDNTPLNDELYFKSLVSGNMSFEVFKKSQTNFYSAVCYFSRPLFMLCSRIDSYSERLNILENIFDEHGNGDVKKSHGKTYKQYLINLGVKEHKIKKNEFHISVKNFFSKVDNIVSNDDPQKAIAMYGIIEDRYTIISSIIAKTLLKNNWLDESKLAHYLVHEEIDMYHSKLFYDLIQKKWLNRSSNIQIKEGLNLGNELILKLFNELLLDN